MKPPDLYGDWRVILGLMVLLLGAGNWLVGLNGTRQYRRLAADTGPAASELYRNFDELDSRSGGAVLEPLTQEQQAASYAAAQLDFYHMVYVTGQGLFMAGLAITLVAFLGAIRQDSRRMAFANQRRLRPDEHSKHNGEDGEARGTANAGQDQPQSAGDRPAS